MFFFFKQKTAYEMRISDWSSDVCSSDLSVRADQQCGDAGFLSRQRQPSAGGEVERGCTTPDLDDECTSPSAAQDVVSRPEQGGDVADNDEDKAVRLQPPFDKAGTKQSGRAWGRERGCQ